MMLLSMYIRIQYIVYDVAENLDKNTILWMLYCHVSVYLHLYTSCYIVLSCVYIRIPYHMRQGILYISLYIRYITYISHIHLWYKVYYIYLLCIRVIYNIYEYIHTHTLKHCDGLRTKEIQLVRYVCIVCVYVYIDG